MAICRIPFIPDPICSAVPNAEFLANCVDRYLRLSRDWLGATEGATETSPCEHMRSLYLLCAVDDIQAWLDRHNPNLIDLGPLRRFAYVSQAVGTRQMQFFMDIQEPLVRLTKLLEPMKFAALPCGTVSDSTSAQAETYANQSEIARDGNGAQASETTDAEAAGDQKKIPFLDTKALKSGQWVTPEEVVKRYKEADLPMCEATLKKNRAKSMRRRDHEDFHGLYFRLAPNAKSNDQPYYYSPRTVDVIAARKERKR